MATVELEDEAVATSSGYEKFRIIGGRRLSHLIDLRTGQPAAEVISATILALTAMDRLGNRSIAQIADEQKSRTT